MDKKLTLKKTIANIAFHFNPFRTILDVARGEFRVLTYHSITDDLIGDDNYQMTTPKELFKEQMRYLNENSYSVIPCGEMIDNIKENKEMPPKTICITFDDGFKDNLTNAAPILARYGFRATIFLTVNFIGRSEQWLNWDDLMELTAMGIFSFGSHSLSHKKLHRLETNELKNEMGLSKNILEDHLRTTIDLFAYPFGCYGSFDKSAVDAVKSAGYKAAFTTIAGSNTIESDPYLMRRTRISWFDDKYEFAKELEGAYDWYELWQKIRRTL